MRRRSRDGSNPTARLGRVPYRTRPSRPHRSPHRRPRPAARRIRRPCRRHWARTCISTGRRGPRDGRAPRCIGLHRLTALEHREPPRHYQHEQPGDMIHIDTKRSGCFVDFGHRVSGDRSTDSPRGRPAVPPRHHPRPFADRLDQAPSRQGPGQRGRPSRDGRGLLRAPRHHRSGGAHRQRQRLPLTGVCPALPAVRAPPPPHAALTTRGPTASPGGFIQTALRE